MRRVILFFATALASCGGSVVPGSDYSEPQISFSMGYGVGGEGSGNPCGKGFEKFYRKQGGSGPPITFCVSGPSPNPSLSPSLSLSPSAHECADDFVRNFIDEGKFAEFFPKDSSCKSLDLVLGYVGL